MRRIGLRDVPCGVNDRADLRRAWGQFGVVLKISIESIGAPWRIADIIVIPPVRRGDLAGKQRHH